MYFLEIVDFMFVAWASKLVVATNAVAASIEVVNLSNMGGLTNVGDSKIDVSISKSSASMEKLVGEVVGLTIAKRVLDMTFTEKVVGRSTSKKGVVVTAASKKGVPVTTASKKGVAMMVTSKKEVEHKN